MKRMLSLLLVAAMLLGLTPAFAAGKTPFEDVPAGVWYEDAAAYLSEQGYVNGVSKTQFDPDGSMTRAMVVTILHRMGGGVLDSQPSGFVDVPAGAWFAAAVDWAAANDITNGVDKTHFNPDGVVTREMLSTLLWRYAALRYDDEYIGRYKARLAFTDADPAVWIGALSGCEIHHFGAAGDLQSNEDLAAFAADHPELRGLFLGWAEDITDLTPLLALENLERVEINRDMREAIASLDGQSYGFRLEIQG